MGVSMDIACWEGNSRSVYEGVKAGVERKLRVCLVRGEVCIGDQPCMKVAVLEGAAEKENG